MFLVDVIQLKFFFLILSRISGIFVFAPIFAVRSIPAQIKVSIILMMSYITYQIIPVNKLVVDIHLIYYGLTIVNEMLIGVVLGMLALMVLGVIQFAGKLTDILMGLHIASVMDPMTKEQQSMLGQFMYVLAILLFLFFDGHHYILQMIIKTFDVAPIGVFAFKPFLYPLFLKVFSSVFILGFQMAAPIVGITMLINVALGLGARAVPQMNVFLLGMPVKIGVGLLMLHILVIYLFPFYKDLFLIIKQTLIEYLGILSVG
jgi:flagellar biosynthesis protein FliR